MSNNGYLTMREIEQKTTARYFYNTEDNKPNYMKCRYIDRETGEEIKGTYYSCIDLVENLWKIGLNGHSHILYKLPELLQAIKDGVKRIFIVEGEKDTDTLILQGETATTSGAWNSWKDEFKEYFKGYTGEVIILPDQDPPDPKKPGEAPNGQKYGEAVFNSLAGIVPLVYIVNVTDGKDISDFLQVKTMANFETLITIARTSRINQMEIDNMSDDFCQVEALPEQKEEKKKEKNWLPLEDISLKDFLEKKYEPIKFLVEDILPEGLSIISGSPKIGKTFLALNLGLSIATGSKTLGHLRTEKVGVAYFAIDEKDQYIQEKINCIREFQEKNVIPDNFRLMFKMNRLSEGGYEQITDYIDRHPDLKLIVIDTLGRVRKPSGRGNAYEIDVEAIGQLQDICKEKNVSILLLHHNKKGKSEDFIENLSGSMGLSGTVDTILCLERARGETEGTLKVTGRLIRDEKDLSVKFNKDLLSWEILGDAELYKQSKERRELIDIFLKEEYPISNKELSELSGRNYSTIKGLTWRMEKDGLLLKVKNGCYTLSPSFLCDKKVNSLNSLNPINSLNSLNPINRVEPVDVTVDRVDVGLTSLNSENLSDNKEKVKVGLMGLTGLVIKQNIKCSNCINFTGKNKTGFFSCGITKESYYPMSEHICNKFSPMELAEDFNREEVPF